MQIPDTVCECTEIEKISSERGLAFIGDPYCEIMVDSDESPLGDSDGEEFCIIY